MPSSFPQRGSINPLPRCRSSSLQHASIVQCDSAHSKVRVSSSLLAVLLGASGSQSPSRRDINSTARIRDNSTPRRFIVELKSRAHRARVSVEPDNDPIDHYGHETHVAGIIAGKSDQFVGVALGTKLLSFKVFGSSGYSNEEMVIEGFLKAFDSGVDIISASLGEDSSFTSNVWAVLASRMVDQGVVIPIDSGNEGNNGPFDTSNGASGKDVITVGSAEPGAFPAQAFAAEFNSDGQSNKTQIAYIPTPTDFGFCVPTTQGGAGFIDAERVLNYTTELSFEGRKFELNDTAHFQGTHAAQITNYGSAPVAYNFSLQDAAGYDS
ncbi:peptidase S8/S53 domain-containing protein [Hypoxylon sp. FL1857]|nr:peptidase S8/S53 domain-containing protein [Hypoxylon sp. FL1857]